MSWRLVYTKRRAEGRSTPCRGRPQGPGAGPARLLAEDPLRSPPPFEKLVGDLAGAYSRRINIQHRLVYQVLPEERVVKVLRMWSHYK